MVGAAMEKGNDAKVVFTSVAESLFFWYGCGSRISHFPKPAKKDYPE
jgi:hypothetical protein